MEKKCLEEKTSNLIGCKYVDVEYNGNTYKLCDNGVVFKNDEWKNYTKESLIQEYKTRKRLFDYEQTVKNGVLTKKTENVIRQKEEVKKGKISTPKKDVTLSAISFALLVTSVGCMYMSTLHTAEYLYDYMAKVNSWLLSSVVTIYASMAFEVVLLFKKKKNYGRTCLFFVLWVCVTLFSMTTTVSLFYDRYNFKTLEIAEENKEDNKSVFELELLREQKNDLDKQITKLNEEMEYYHELKAGTSVIRSQIEELTNERKLVTERMLSIAQQGITEKKEQVKEKQTFFDFLGNLLGISGDVLSFILSTLPAIFINLIAPFSVSIVVTLNKEIK